MRPPPSLHGMTFLLGLTLLGCHSRPLHTPHSALGTPHPNSRPGVYPIGIYGVNSTNDFETVHAAGFNLIVGRADQPYLDSAHAAGLQVLAAPGTFAGPKFDAASARATVNALDAHPALWAWYLIDEPDLNLVPPAEVAAAHRFLKNLPARKPTALVLYQGYEALHYARITDLTMVDRYPVPWLPLANFGQHVEMVRLALGPQKPLLAVIQAFDWTYAKDLLGDETPLRPPTYEEMRCMTYEALARGATGLFYYAFDSGWKMTEHPETWAALTAIVHEVRAKEALFQAQPVWWPKEHAFGNRATRFNEALQSSITSTRLRVQHGNGEIPAGEYVLAVNNTTNRHTYWFKRPRSEQSEGRGQTSEVGRQKTEDSRQRAAGSGEERDPELETVPVPVLGENRAIASTKHWVRDVFEAYEVHVYGPLP